MAEYDSSCSESVLSVSDIETESSTGLGNYDIALYCHLSVEDKALDAEKILLLDNLTTCVSTRDAPAGRASLANLYSVAKRSNIRVFIITDKFLQNDFECHLRLLENAKLSTKKNTLLLMRRRHWRKMPEHLQDLTCHYFQDHISGEEIADFIKEFMNSQALGFEEKPDEDCGMFTEDDEQKERSEATDTHLQKYEKEFQKFEETFGKVTKKRCYVLIASPIRDRIPCLKLVVSVPWVRVFDFDTKSSASGLLLWADEALSEKHHTKQNKPDQIETPDDNITNWVSIAGDPDIADSVNNRNIRIPDHTILRHCECLAEYCMGQKIPTILVMWYPNNSNMDKALDDFLSGLRHHLMGRLHSFKCIVCLKEMPNKRGPLYRMLDRLNIVSNIIVVPIDVLCKWLESCSNYTPPTSSSSKMLPRYPDQEGDDLMSVEIEEEELVWIRSQLYILVKTQNGNDSQHSKTIETIKPSGVAFLRGGEIRWNVLENGCYDVRRELLDKVKGYIQEKHIDTGKSGLITIYHAPGGGGTTFARRLLFELHERVPSGELKSDRISLKGLEERLVTLRNLTMLPTVILLDGKNMHDVQRLLAIGIKLRIILIHVRRYILESEKAPSGDGKFFLHADVSHTEATSFSQVYGRVAPRKVADLKSLSMRQDGSHPYIFEYGLTAFESQYQGVRRYVHGYLQVHETPELKNWHTVLVFLSMTNYYGHRGLPCKLFSKILDKDDSDIVELDELPHPARQFITEEEEIWRITHYAVSKLILEQILVKRSTTEYKSSEYNLTRVATQELYPWALLFIENIKEYVGDSKLASHIWEILTSVFIRRNYDDPGENELGSKTHYSKLIEDIGVSTEQKAIFKKLAESFPGQAELRAHLGRFHSKQGEFDEAEQCFKLALETRKREIRRHEPVSVSIKHQELTKGDYVLERICSMTAFAYMSHIRSKIGVRMGKMKPATLRGKSLPTLIKFCLEKADLAIKNFEAGRQYYQKGSNPSFTNLGELKVRLQMTELAKLVSKDNFKSLLEKQTPYKELGDFVLSSFHECDMLLAQCISDRSKNFDVPEEEINLCFNHFNYFYQTATAALEHWAGNDSTIHAMKCHLSILKAKLKQNKRHFRVNEDIKTGEEIWNLVQLCERICDTVWKYNANNIRISGYMVEWLRAIRHRYMIKRYSQVDVLSRVEKWKNKKETGTLANFYHYVITTMLSLTSLSGETANTYAESSHKMKEHMKQNDAAPLYLFDTGEWLGQGDNPQEFSRLIHSSDLGEWNGKFWKDPEMIGRLQVCTGSILFCRPHDGIIVMDGGRSPAIDIFFVPQKYYIGLSHSRKRTRVEFYLGFNPRHFSQAYEVTLLKKFPCPGCRAPTEISTLGRDPGECQASCNMCETVVNMPPQGE